MSETTAVETVNTFQPEAGKTYVENEPYRAPEDTAVFQVVHVADYPGEEGVRLAFGFGTASWPGDCDWTPGVMDLSVTQADKWLEAEFVDGKGWNPKTGIDTETTV